MKSRMSREGGRRGGGDVAEQRQRGRTKKKGIKCSSGVRKGVDHQNLSVCMRASQVSLYNLLLSLM